VTLGLLLLGLVAPTGHAEVEAFEITPPLSRDGVYALSWTAGGEVGLEEAGDDAFRDVHVVYRGADEGTVLTGRPEGVYFYRVRAAGAPESEAVRAFVQVEHHSFGRALVFFVVGLVVFVSTIGLVVRGPDERREESEGAGGSGGGASPGSETQGGRANG